MQTNTEVVCRGRSLRLARGETGKSAIAEHAWNELHHPDWDNTSILDQAKHNSTLLVKEARHISLAAANTLLNRESTSDSSSGGVR